MTTTPDYQAEVERLAVMSRLAIKEGGDPVAYDLARRAKAKELGIGLTPLDDAIAAAADKIARAEYEAQMQDPDHVISVMGNALAAEQWRAKLFMRALCKEVLLAKKSETSKHGVRSPIAWVCHNIPTTTRADGCCGKN